MHNNALPHPWRPRHSNFATRFKYFVPSLALCAAVGLFAQAAPASRDLAGAIDIHVHSAPDNVARSLDGLEAARFAKAAGEALSHSWHAFDRCTIQTRSC